MLNDICSIVRRWTIDDEETIQSLSIEIVSIFIACVVHFHNSIEFN